MHAPIVRNGAKTTRYTLAITPANGNILMKHFTEVIKACANVFLHINNMLDLAYNVYSK